MELLLLDADQKIITVIAQNPGANIGQTAKALLRDYSGAYAKDRVHTLIARGVIRAEVSPAGRYRLYLSDENKPLEA